jgi:hypothetical protein
MTLYVHNFQTNRAKVIEFRVMFMFWSFFLNFNLKLSLWAHSLCFCYRLKPLNKELPSSVYVWLLFGNCFWTNRAQAFPLLLLLQSPKQSKSAQSILLIKRRSLSVRGPEIGTSTDRTFFFFFFARVCASVRGPESQVLKSRFRDLDGQGFFF